MKPPAINYAIAELDGYKEAATTESDSETGYRHKGL